MNYLLFPTSHLPSPPLPVSPSPRLPVSPSPPPLSAYIHIPFCRRRCYYCDFPISVLGDRADPNQSGSVAEYVEVLCQEIQLAPTFARPLETIFFGGGTPSLLPVRCLESILGVLQKHFGLASEVEISMEMDPGTFTQEQLQGYLKAGVNRISLGVQAFQKELLQVCGRSHSVEDIFAAMDLLRQERVVNLSLDLISGLPHQTLAQWQASLQTAIKLAPQHISCYDLVLEPVTAFGKRFQPGERPLPTDEIAAQMYRLAQQMLTEAGYKHYEISNYAQSSFQCRHNRVYWQNKPYYGFGMGAASYVLSQRFTRPRNRREYYAWVEQLADSGGMIDCPQSSSTDRLLETLMLGLRLAEGVNLSLIKQEFGREVVQKTWTCLQPYFRQEWIEVIDRYGKSLCINETGLISDQKYKNVTKALEENYRLRLTDPEGFLFSNTVLAELFEALE